MYAILFQVAKVSVKEKVHKIRRKKCVIFKVKLSGLTQRKVSKPFYNTFHIIQFIYFPFFQKQKYGFHQNVLTKSQEPALWFKMFYMEGHLGGSVG